MKATLVLLWLVALTPATGSVILERLIGAGDVVPDTPPGTVILGASKPHIAGDYVVAYLNLFTGQASIQGLWLWDGSQFHRVVDTTMPEAQAGILDNRLYAVDESGLVAVNIESYAMMGWKDSQLFPIAGDGSPAPNGPPGATFVSFSHPVVRDGVVYFLGALTDLPQGENVFLYSWRQSTGLQLVDLPGLCCYGVPAVWDDGIVLLASVPPTQANWFGIWHHNGSGTTAELFDLADQFPGAPPGAFWLSNTYQLGAVSDAAVINAMDSEGTTSGLFRISQIGPELILRPGDPLPESGEPVVGVLPEFSANGDRVAFDARITILPHPGYLAGGVVVQDADRSLHRILYGGDVLEGLQVFSVTTTYGALSGDRIALEVQRPGDVAVWVGDVSNLGGGGPVAPEVPGLGRPGLAVLALCLAVVGLGIRRREPGTWRLWKASGG